MTVSYFLIDIQLSRISFIFKKNVDKNNNANQTIRTFTRECLKLTIQVINLKFPNGHYIDYTY